MRSSDKSTYRNYPVNNGKFKNLRYHTTILEKIIDQIEALLSHHSRCDIIRIDLKLPDPKNTSPSESNKQISHFIKMVKENLKLKRWGSHEHIIHTWVLEKAQNNHYHAIIGFKHTQLSLGSFDAFKPTGLFKMLTDCAQKSYKGKIFIAGRHTINRGNKKEIDSCIYHTSYLAKTNTKAFSTGQTHRRYSTSQVTHKNATNPTRNSAQEQYSINHIPTY